MRVFYAAGPGNVIGSYKYFARGERDPGQVSVTYSGQFFDVCRQGRFDALAVTSFPTPDVFTNDRARIENLPIPMQGRSGIWYHLGSLLYALKIAWRALRHRSDVAFISHIDYLFVLALLVPFGIKLVPVYHCVLWRQNQTPKRSERILKTLNHWFLRRCSSAIMTIGPETTAQAQSVVAGTAVKVFPFYPTFEASFLEPADPIPQSDLSSDRQVLYAGRIERNKGVFDLIDVARRLGAMGRNDVHFDLCGTGSALDEARREVEASGLSDRVRLHGQVEPANLVKMYHSAYLVIVPTTSSFGEGVNKVVAEAVLCHKPVITSRLSNCEDLFGEALVLVPPDDREAYTEAVLRLVDNPDYYESVRAGSYRVGAPLLDLTQSWGAAMRSALAFLYPRLQIEPGHGTPPN